MASSAIMGTSAGEEDYDPISSPSSAVSFGNESSSPPGPFSDRWNRPLVAEVSGGDDLTLKRDCDDCIAASSGEVSTVPAIVATSSPSTTPATPYAGALASPSTSMLSATSRPLSMFRRWECSSTPAKVSPKEETPQQ